MDETLHTTLLDALHRENGARMVPFAGWSMPVQYSKGIIAEHLHCRAAAALFDVSHMGQVSLEGEAAAAALETLVPADIIGLAQGRQRYTQFLNPQGGILDDLMVARLRDRLLLVINAANTEADLAHLRAHLRGVLIVPHPDRALLALQGPAAGNVLARILPETEAMRFMDVIETNYSGDPITISRSGYTGEDGFEISLPADGAEEFARLLLSHSEVKLAGLGARDTLRLEAGLCLAGQDIGPATTPYEAALGWSIPKRRRLAEDFIGAVNLAQRPARKFVGIRPEDRAPARTHTKILNDAGAEIGEITSGGFSPTLNAPIALGYVPITYAEAGTRLQLELRGRAVPASVVPLPFVPHRYRTGDRS